MLSRFSEYFLLQGCSYCNIFTKFLKDLNKNIMAQKYFAKTVATKRFR